MEQKNDVNPKLSFKILACVIEVVAQVPNGRARNSMLSALAQTCSSLLPLCRRNLFSAVSLRPYFPARITSGLGKLTEGENKVPSIDFQTMKSLLEDNPEIANYVRILYLNLSSSESSLLVLPLLGKFNYVDKLVIASFTFFSSTRSPVLDSYYFDEWKNPLDWKSLSPPLQLALKTTIYHPTLTTIQLTRICNFPTDILLPCINLRALYIIHSHLLSLSPNTETSYDNFNPIKLKTMTLYPGAESNAQVLCYRRPDGLSYFDIPGIPFINMTLHRTEDIPQLKELLENAHQLKLLDITFEDSDLQILSEMAEIPASSWGNVHHLVLSGPTTRQGEAHHWKIDIYLFEVLKTLSQAFNHLQKLELRFAVFCFPTVEAALFKNLLGLATLLSSPARFPCLTSVVIEMHIIGARHLDQIRTERWCSVLKEQMAILTRNHALHVNLSAPVVLPRLLRSGTPNETPSAHPRHPTAPSILTGGATPKPFISRPESSTSAELGRGWRARESGVAGTPSTYIAFGSRSTRGGAGGALWRSRRGHT